jgi:uncharacterized HAD superfamily protein
MKIGIDIDDVLADSLPHYTRAFNQRFGLQIDLSDAAWRIFDRFPRISHQEADDFFSELIEAGFFSSRPLLPGAKEAVESLAKEGHRLFIITGRAPQDEAVTKGWLARVGLLSRFDAEDELAVATAVAETAIPVLLFDRPWNQGVLPGNVRRVRSWTEALIRIADLNGGEGKRKAGGMFGLR